MNASIVVGEAGRVVLPKAIRERLHLRKGTKLKADIVGDKIELSLLPDTDVRIERRGKRLVIVGGEPFDAVAAIKADREERDEAIVRRLKVP